MVEGGRKRDTGEDKELQPGEIAIRPPRFGEQDPAEKDPFAKLEGKVEDKRRAQTETSRILELQQRQSRDWDDPYEKSKRLRRTFRAERKGLEKLKANREALKEKMSLGIEVVDETEADRQRAGMVDFGGDQATVGDMTTHATWRRPMFEQRAVQSAPSTGTRDNDRRSRPQTRTKDLIAQRKTSLRHGLTGNTRAAVDPFLNDVGHEREVWKPGVKRKKSASTASPLNDAKDPAGPSAVFGSQDTGTPPVAQPAPTLVTYASDTD